VEGEEKPAKGMTSPPGFPLEAERWPRILSDARLLLGHPQHLSIHPGGMVITPRSIEEYVPLQMAPKGVVITQFEKDAIEHIGLVKIDLLGNRALATVDEAQRIVDSETLPTTWRQVSNLPEPFGKLETCRHVVGDDGFSDTAAIDLLQRGDTLGVNQLESPAMRHLLIQMQPRAIDDVIQALALIRPGAASVGAKETFIRRRRGLEPVAVAHPLLEPLLSETQGLMLYEDDALHVIQALTGLPAPDADRFRKRVTKHRTEEEALALAKEFLQACLRNGIPHGVAAELWEQLAKFNHYSFCKSHAVSYGLIAWKAVQLKTRQPLAFWTAALNNNQGMYPRRVYIEAIKRAGIRLRLPCVNRSSGPFAVEDDAIRVGLDAIGSLNEELRATIVANRQQHGPYRDLADFRCRIRPGPEALALLIRSGALDFTGMTRPALFLEAELQDHARSLGDGLFQQNLSQDWSPADYALDRRLRDEWELFGFLTGPPLLSLFRPHLPPGLITSRELPEHAGRVVQVAGLVATGRHTPMSDGRVMQFVTLEDECGLIEVTLFPGACPPVAYLALGPYLVTGMVEEQYGVRTVTARSFRLKQ